MTKSIRILLSLFLVIMATMLVSGCASMVTKGEEFPLMYEEAPLTVLILPPINETTAADAKDYYSTTVQAVFANWGYYVFSYEITADIMKMEGVYDAELLRDLPVTKFGEYFGADAVLFTTIKRWDLSYMVLASSLTVSIDLELKSTKTDQVMWNYTGTVVVDLSGGSAGQGGLAGLLVSAVITAAKTAMADYVPYARQANVRAIATLPFGMYHPQHMSDQSMQFPDQTPQEKNQ